MCLFSRKGDWLRDGDYRQVSYFLTAERHRPLCYHILVMKEFIYQSQYKTFPSMAKPVKDSAFEQIQSTGRPIIVRGSLMTIGLLGMTEYNVLHASQNVQICSQ